MTTEGAVSRVKVFDENQALDAAMLAFWKSGYSATSIQDLEQATGLKRTSIYNAFGDKRQLFKLALQRYLTTVLSGFLEALERPRTVHEAITAVLNEVIKLHFNKTHPGGCMVILSLMEDRHHDVETRKILERAVKKLRDAVVARLRRAVTEGELPAELDCQRVGNQVMATLTGMIVMAKANIARKELKALTECTAAALLPELDV